MTTLLEITELANGDVVLREADTEAESHNEPLVRIRFSGEVRDMLGKDLVSVAEAMIDAATEYLEADADEAEEMVDDVPPTVH
ncbi:MAG: hypothetical protein CMD39_09465 [Gammaproteobacteria bacterium]|nr:hypothetical protein [Gammaproteobacteria bacterium]|tara:strand:+ start:3276 stop:3524 length:249 start_codon:yes stop_codon:yes gene_type:complete